MKRYRFMEFFIDGTRAIVNNPNLPPVMIEAEKDQLREFVIAQHGVIKAEEKFDRYLQLSPPNICVIVEYYELMHEVENSYVSMNDYPALTGACCLGERILNSLILRLRDYYKSNESYKQVYRLESIQDWPKAIDILTNWHVLEEHTILQFRELNALRNFSVHYQPLDDIQAHALRALNLVMKITDTLFGTNNEIFFWCPGELYIRQSKQLEPFVKEFFIPHCPLVGYKHSVEGTSENLFIKDATEYESSEVDDDIFKELRIRWQQRAANPT